MKKVHKIISFVLVFAMLILSCASAYAGGMLPGSESIVDLVPINTGLNDLAVRAAATEFFTKRADYLTGESDAFDIDVSGIISDEAAHISKLEAQSITISNIEFVISNSVSYDSHAEVVVSETVWYSANGAVGAETVTHLATLYLNEDGVPVVAADAYRESFSGFCSASYVADSTVTMNATSGGSGPCITYVANQEVGYVETHNDITKYGEWYGFNGAAWCAIFVSWCAYMADIDTSVIFKTAGPPEMLDKLNQQSRFYYSPANGGTQSPQVGDIFFLGSNINAPSHVGIIVSVDVNNIYVVDGNWSNQVCYRSISRNATDLLGYGRPNYATSVHSYSYTPTETHHHGECAHCGRTTSTTTHSYLGYESNATKHWQECITCKYTTAEVSHIGGAFNSNGTHHWKNCTTCSVQINRAAHTLVLISVGEGYRCSVCGYRTQTSVLD